MIDIPIPRRMAHLPLDHRGYPIPAGVWRDSDGRVHFTINDQTTRLKHLAEDRCPICGTRLIGGRWFIGGPLSAFDDNGAYFDLPMHYECMQYALRTCPWLAAPRYSREIQAKTVPTGQQDRIFIDHTQMPGRPTLFVTVLALSQTTVRRQLTEVLIPKRPYLRVEFWQHGRQLSGFEGRLMAEGALRRPIQSFQKSKVFRK